MSERFTDRARRMVAPAREARMLDYNNIGIEHLLLGLIHEGVAAQAMLPVSAPIVVESP